MATYYEQTVAQLKELLQERSLSLDGLKKDLIQRLEDDDQEREQERLREQDKIEEAKEKEQESRIEESKIENVADASVASTEANENIDTKQNQEKDEGKAKEVEEEEREENVENTLEAPTKELSAEEIKKMALDLLNKKLYRANKFAANQDEIDSINRLINRVEKFGLDLSNPLARELGLVKDVPKINKNKNNKKNAKKNTGKGSRNNDNRQRVRKGGNNRSQRGRRY